MNLEPVWEECRRQGWEPDERRQAALRGFLDALYRENAHTNLTRVPPEEAPIRHVVDALLVLPYLPESGRILDIGCGPGFPAWVLAWARPPLIVEALDATAKMQRFLASQPLPNLRQRLQRAEDGIEYEMFDAVTGRAVAPFGIQAELSAAWLRIGGVFVPFRTLAERRDIETTNVGVLGLKLRQIHEILLPDGSGTRLFPVFEKARPTPGDYPRTWARIKAKPLTSR